MEILTGFVTPSVAALIVAIWALLEIAKKVRPQIKDNKFLWNFLPYTPPIIGVLLALIPGVVSIPEGSSWSHNVGNMVVIGIACGGLATMGRQIIKRTFLEKFEDKSDTSE